MSKINVFDIVKDHVSTFKNYETNEYRPWDFIAFFGLTFVVSMIIVFFQPSLGYGVPNALLTSASVFTALMLNLLVLIYNLMQKTNVEKNKEDNPDDYSSQFIKEIYYNISFSILISMTTVIFLIIYSLNLFKDGILINYGVINFNINVTLLFTFIIYYLLSIFILTIFMILKRVHILLSEEFKESNEAETKEKN